MLKYQKHLKGEILLFIKLFAFMKFLNNRIIYYNMTNNKYLKISLISFAFITAISFVSLAETKTIYDESAGGLSKYGPDSVIRTDTQFEGGSDTVFHDTPVADTTISGDTANLISQIVIVNQGDAAVAKRQSDIEQNGPAASAISNITPNNNVSISYANQTQASATGLPTPFDATSQNTSNQISTPIATSLNFSNLVEKNISATKPTLSSPTYALINASTNQIYATKNQNEKYMSSGLANLMTAYIATQYLKMDSVLNVKATAVTGLDKDASIIALRAGDKITLKDAIISMFVKGAVDAANVVAENVAGSKSTFVELMNTTAASFGLTNTKFVDPAGILDENETTALEMAVIMGKVCEKPELVELLRITQYTLPATEKREKLIIYNRNTQLTKEAGTYNADIAGSRMAYTSKSKYCIASLMNNNNNKIIAVILKAEGTQFGDTKKLMEFAKVASAE